MVLLLWFLFVSILILLGWFSWKVFYPRLSTFSNWQMYLIPGISIVLYLLLVSGLILGLMHWSRLKKDILPLFIGVSYLFEC